MDELTVSGAFMLTIGHGAGPEVIAIISAQTTDGTPFTFDVDQPEIQVVTGLTAMFGTASFRCKVVDVEGAFRPPRGFVSVTLDLEDTKELGRLAHLGLAALAVVVDTGSARGQAVLVSAGAATPQTWWAGRQPDAPR